MPMNHSWRSMPTSARLSSVSCSSCLHERRDSVKDALASSGCHSSIVNAITYMTASIPGTLQIENMANTTFLWVWFYTGMLKCAVNLPGGHHHGCYDDYLPA